MKSIFHHVWSCLSNMSDSFSLLQTCKAVLVQRENGAILDTVRGDNKWEQESPPAWTQEAYRPPCSEYSFCCPTWVTPPGGVPCQVPPLGGGGGTQSGTPPGGTRSGTPPGLGTPLGGYPVRYPPRGGTRSGTPLTGYPPGGYPVRYPPDRVPPRGGTQSGTPPPNWVPPPGGYPVRYPGGYLVRYPPCYPMAFWEMLQSIMGYGYPPCGQTNTCENSTFPSYYVRGR